MAPPPNSSAQPLKVSGSTPSKPPTRQNTRELTSTPNNANGTGSSSATNAGPTSVSIVTNPSDISSPHELTAYVESLLEQLDSRFDDMSNQILDRMMQMSTRVDALEASIQDIINGDINSTPPPLPQSPPPPGSGSAPKRAGSGLQ
ncbi:hypothetical protein JAAARDRAFT_33867 [Jaapia argillacea MUCL 33604]|uniref:Heat shock factor-binding protein 1 n=1 Tax=Jaapia argillacea MUCL 33604 TaxID=933084 RepID=A0A067PWP5_9AGAM|nr:hypothetical protein JAAARDRAFT_33867 [Jaapia argillacea MUCL 33604]